MRSTSGRPKHWLIIYGVAVELFYIMYESELSAPDLPRDVAGLGSGLLLVVTTLPWSIVAGFLQYGAGHLLGYGDNYSHAFWPRFVAFQVVIALNLHLLSQSSRSRSIGGNQGDR